MDTQRIIKADSMRQAGQKIVFDFQDFHQHCDSQLQKVQDHANQRISEAQERAISIEQQARSEGYQAGYAEGLKRANEEIQKRVDALAKHAIDEGLTHKLSIMDSLTEAIAEAKLKWMAHWERIAIEFSVLMAEKIIRSEIARQPEIPGEMIRNLLEVVSSEERVIVRVHPDDAQYFQDLNQTTSSSSPFHRFIEFQADSSLERGDCLAEMEFGMLDGRVATQLQRIQQELSPGLNEEGE